MAENTIMSNKTKNNYLQCFKRLSILLLLLVISTGNSIAGERFIFSGQDNAVKSENISWFEDKSDKLSVDEIIKLCKSNKFIFGEADIPNLGYKECNVWFHVAFINETDIDNLLLELDFANYSEVELYICDSVFRIIEIQKQGIRNLPNNSEELHRCPIFEINAIPGTHYNFLFKIKNDAPIIFPLYVHTNRSFLKKDITRSQFSFIFFGLLIATVLFNLIFFFITRNKSYVFLALHLFFSLCNFIFYFGFGYQYFHFLNPEFLLMLKFDFFALSGLFHMLFVIYYLELPKKGFLKRIAIIDALFFALFFLVTISGIFSVRIIAQYTIYAFLISPIISLTIATVSILKKNRNAVYYLIAFGIQIIASLVFTFTTAGVLQFSIFNLNVQVFAQVIFGVLLSIGLTEQFAVTNAMRASNMQLEKDKDLLIAEVNERIRVEKQLIESENKFRQLIELLPHPLILTDQATGLILEVNKELCKVAGFNKDELIGKPTVELGFWDFENRDDYLKELLSTGKTSGKQLKMKVAGSKELPVLMYSEIIEINDNSRILTLIVDISDLKKNQEALELSEKNLRISNKTKDKFFSIIAHDLQNPLNVMLAYNKQLYTHLISRNLEKAEQYTKTMQNITENTGALIQNLLSWARVQTGLINYHPEQIRALSIIENEIFFTKEGFDKKEISLTYNCPLDLIIFGDVNMLGTIIRNLLSNAYKFTNRGGSVHLIAEKEKNLYKITVTDNGIGINSLIKNNLFKIDELTHTSGTEDESGTGLGLILCNEFIKLHNGTIEVESEFGNGSKFCVSWPLKSRDGDSDIGLTNQ